LKIRREVRPTKSTGGARENPVLEIQIGSREQIAKSSLVFDRDLADDGLPVVGENGDGSGQNVKLRRIFANICGSSRYRLQVRLLAADRADLLSRSVADLGEPWFFTR
jgi:hypothetical protein